jgi:uncharacterized coiled-coil DUF342 family protein
MTIKEIKAEIRRLRKVKKDLRPGSAERLDLGHKIKALKKQLADMSISEPGKEKLIQEIYRIDPLTEKMEMDLTIYTEAELQKHIDRIKAKRPC